MTKLYYSLFDKKSRMYGDPIAFENEAVAKRNLSVLIGGNPIIKNHLDDFDVLYVGMFDFETGKFMLPSDLLDDTELTKPLKEFLE